MSKQFKTMVRMLMDSGAGWSSKGQNAENRKSNKVVIIFLLLIALPLAFAFGFISFYLAFLLDGSGMESTVLNLGIGIASMTMLFFGILMVPSVFYFADDIQYLIPMPIKPINIINSKFYTTWIWENLTAVFVFLPMMIGFSIGTHVNWYYWVYGIIVLFTLSLIPLFYGAILNILLIRFTSFGKNRRLLSYATSILSIGLSVGLSVYLLNNLYSGTGNVFYTLALSSDSFVNILDNIFPYMTYASTAMTTGSISSFLAYIGIILVTSGIYYITAKLFYYKGLMKLTSQNKHGRALTDNQIRKKSSRKGQTFALAKKELTNLFINPSYFSACISSNLILPLIFLFMPHTSLWEMILTYLNQSVSVSHRNLYLLDAVILVAIMTAGMNYIASTAFSREGSDYQSMKYMPVEFGKQVSSKMIVAFGIFMAVFLFSFGLLMYYIKLSPVVIVDGLLLGPLVGFHVIEVGMLIDLFNPVLNWDDEQKAVKQNFNGMLGLIYSLVIALVIVFITNAFRLYLSDICFAMMILFILIDSILYIYLRYYSDKCFERM